MAVAKGFAWPGGKRAALSVTFDDSRESQLDRGIPVLNDHAVRGTFFVSPGRFEKRVADWGAAAAGGHEIANHTMTHPCSGNFAFARDRALESFSLDRMEDDILEANDIIEAELGLRPQTFAYPCGQTYVGRGADTRSYVPIIHKHFLAGRNAFNESHNCPDFCDLAQLFSIDADCGSVSGLMARIDAAAEEGGWLVFMIHDVGEAQRQTIQPTVLAAVCEYAMDPERAIWVDTLAKVAAHVKDRQAV